MAAIYLIRHGQARFAADNYDQLSEVGVEQAQVLGKDFAARLPAPDVVVSGTMVRHQQTLQHAMLQQNNINPTPVINTNWNEFNHQQILAAYNPNFAESLGVKLHLQRQANPEQAFMVLFHAAIKRWLSGEYDNYQETWQQFRQRVERGFAELCQQIQQHEYKSAFVFTSGGPISALLMQQLGLSVSNMTQVNRVLVNCGVTKFITSKEQVYLSSSNEHSLFDSFEYRHLITYK